MFRWFNPSSVSLLTERGLNKGCGSYKHLAPLERMRFRKLHLKLESAKDKQATSRLPVTYPRMKTSKSKKLEPAIGLEPMTF